MWHQLSFFSDRSSRAHINTPSSIKNLRALSYISVGLSAGLIVLLLLLGGVGCSNDTPSQIDGRGGAETGGAESSPQDMNPIAPMTAGADDGGAIAAGITAGAEPPDDPPVMTGGAEGGVMGNAGEEPPIGGDEPVTSTVDSWMQMDLRWEHGCGISGSGRLSCWGRNDQDQLSFQNAVQTQNQESGPSAWSAVSVGRAHSCALDDEGTLHCWGRENEGQLSPPEALNSIAQVASGWHQTCVLDDEGQATCWGERDQGQADLPDVRFATLSLGARFGCGLTLEASIACWGLDTYGQATPPTEGQYRQVMTSSGKHACALDEEGHAVCWGDRADDKLSAPTEVFSDLSVGQDHACALTAETSEARCWGANRFGESSPPEGLFTKLFSGPHFTCGLRPEGRLRCWGALMTPSTPLFNDVSVGLAHVCGAKVDGTLNCWGWGRAGRLFPPEGQFDQVASGWEHSCALRRDGAIRCWGVGIERGAFERDGDFDQAVSPLAPSAGGVTYTQVVAGAYHTCALSESGDVRCWGDQRFEQTVAPEETFTSINAGGWHSCGVTSSGQALCWGDDRFGQASPPEHVLFTAISAGLTHSCGVTTEGEGLCWGQPERVNIGDSLSQLNEQEGGEPHSEPTQLGSIRAMTAGGGMTCIVGDEGRGRCTDERGNTFMFEGITRSISAGVGHACALQSDLLVRCQGPLEITSTHPPEGG